MDAAPLLRIHRVLTGLVAGLILVMAAIAGRSIFGTWDIAIHGVIGNAVFLLVLVNLALAVASRAPRSVLAVSGAIVALTFAQTGLGYLGREELDAAAWHIPNGVLLMGLSMFQYAELRGRTAAAAVTAMAATDATVG